MLFDRHLLFLSDRLDNRLIDPSELVNSWYGGFPISQVWVPPIRMFGRTRNYGDTAETNFRNNLNRGHFNPDNTVSWVTKFLSFNNKKYWTFSISDTSLPSISAFRNTSLVNLNAELICTNFPLMNIFAPLLSTFGIITSVRSVALCGQREMSAMVEPFLKSATIEVNLSIMLHGWDALEIRFFSQKIGRQSWCDSHLVPYC